MWPVAAPDADAADSELSRSKVIKNRRMGKR